MSEAATPPHLPTCCCRRRAWWRHALTRMLQQRMFSHWDGVCQTVRATIPTGQCAITRESFRTSPPRASGQYIESVPVSIRVSRVPCISEYQIILEYVFVLQNHAARSGAPHVSALCLYSVSGLIAQMRRQSRDDRAGRGTTRRDYLNSAVKTMVILTTINASHTVTLHSHVSPTAAARTACSTFRRARFYRKTTTRACGST